MERLPSRRNLHVRDLVQRKLGIRDRLLSLEKVLDSFIVLKEF